MCNDIKFHFVTRRKTKTLRENSKNFYNKNIIRRKLEIYFPYNNITLRFSYMTRMFTLNHVYTLYIFLTRDIRYGNQPD